MSLPQLPKKTKPGSDHSLRLTFWLISRRPRQSHPLRWLQDVILDARFPGGPARDGRAVGATTAVQSGGGQLAEAVYPPEALFQTTVPPVADWNFECYQVMCDHFLLLLLAGLFFVATGSK